MLADFSDHIKGLIILLSLLKTFMRFLQERDFEVFIHSVF